MTFAKVMPAFVVTLVAGLSTGIGGLLSMFQKRSSSKFLCLSLGFSAGVMIYLSFMEILPEGLFYLQKYYGGRQAQLYNILAFFGGIGVIAIIDRLVPSADNPHEIPNVLELQKGLTTQQNSHLMRTGILSALAITIHNIPEGLVTFTSY
ncbi:MAG: hypothetical protein GX842_07235 [Spirochaetales bacterium]|nr:hypothetical protein [Spirochaetales bacterium]